VKVSTSSGIVTGMIKRGVAMWRGIPYATAPRFRAPGPAPSWSGERDCVKFGPVAVQSRDPRVAVMSGVGEQIAMSEEALVLNVVAPIPDGRARPVVVWIHGGAFVMGSGSTPIYDGTSFAANHGVVVVTINYRLGLLGFLAVHETNVALLDQIAALRWVKDNIAGFGGDPDRVTVMGESAGAVSIANLLAMPAARGLFQRAILESGGARLSPLTRDDTDAMTREATEALGDPDAASIDAILKLQDRIAAKGGLAAFAPSVDGVHIPISPSAAIAGGSAAGIPILLGSNRDEWTLFEVFLGDAAVTPLEHAVKDYLGPRVDEVLAVYAKNHRSIDRAWIDLIGDVSFRIPMIRLAEAQSAHAPVWMYRFDFESTSFGGRLGAAHALELMFVWNAIDLPVSKILLGEDRIEPARPLARAMHDAWAAFIRGEDPHASALPTWPRYERPARATMRLDLTSEVVLDPGGDARAMWPE